MARKKNKAKKQTSDYKKKPAIQRSKIRKYLYKGYSKKGQPKFTYKGKEISDAITEIEKELKKRGLKSTQSNVRKLYSELFIKPTAEANKAKKKTGKERPPKPELPDFLFDIEGHEFWTIEALIEEISILPETIFIVSPMLLGEGVALQGGKSYGYNETFKEWVDFCNKDILPNLISGSEDVPYWKLDQREHGFYYSETRQRWEVNVISVDPNDPDNRYNYGLFSDTGKRAETPQAPKGTSTLEDVEEKKEIPTKKPEPTEKISKKEEEEIAAIKRKSEIETAELKKKSTLERYLLEKKELLEELKLYKEIGEDDLYNEAKARIKELSEKIKKLND